MYGEGISPRPFQVLAPGKGEDKTKVQVPSRLPAACGQRHGYP